MVKQLPEATLLVDSRMNFIASSKGFDVTFAFITDNSFTRNPISYLSSENSEWSEILEKSVLKKKEMGYRSKISSNDDEKWFDWSFSPWFDENQKLIGGIINVQDATKIVSDDILIDKLNNLIETNTEISKVGVWEYNVITNKLSWSKMTKKIHGVSEDYQPNVDTAIEFYKQGHNQNRVSMLLHNALEKGEEFHEKLQITTVDGTERWVLSSGKPFYKNGEIFKLIGTIQDIDDQIKSEIKLKESEQLLQTLVNNLPLNVYIKDLESRKILVNKSECQFFGVDNPNELLGKNNFDLFDKRTAKKLRMQDLDIMKTQKPVIAKEEVIKIYDDKEVTFLVSKIPLIDARGETYALLGISMDITTIKQKENELRHLIDVTSVQNKKLVNFAHIVSHNLRSHTANFSMLLEFLTNETEENEKDRIMGMLTKASDNLLSTLDNLNEVVKINTTSDAEQQSVSVKKTFDSVHDNLIAILQKNNVKLKVDIPADLKIYGIPAYLDSIILNLFTNAIKYRHPKRAPIITVCAKKESDKVIFSIGDNGIGIDLNKNGDKLFGMYKTFHTNNDARGIGLYITKNQIEAMGGNIVACSEVNVGTTFKVYFNEGY